MDLPAERIRYTIIQFIHYTRAPYFQMNFEKVMFLSWFETTIANGDRVLLKYCSDYFPIATPLVS